MIPKTLREPNSLLVYSYLKKNAADRPSIRGIAGATGLHFNTVQRHLNRLEEAGYIKRTSGGWRGNPNAYQFPKVPE